jgi:hypothetical protein
MFLLYEQQREEKQVTDCFIDNIENILLNGTQLVLNQVFKLIGFNAIDDDILKHLVPIEQNFEQHTRTVATTTATYIGFYSVFFGCAVHHLHLTLKYMY